MARSRSRGGDHNSAGAQVVVWDAIISDPAHAWIRSGTVVNKYSLTDQARAHRMRAHTERIC